MPDVCSTLLGWLEDPFWFDDVDTTETDSSLPRNMAAYVVFNSIPNRLQDCTVYLVAVTNEYELVEDLDYDVDQKSFDAMTYGLYHSTTIQKRVERDDGNNEFCTVISCADINLADPFLTDIDDQSDESDKSDDSDDSDESTSIPTCFLLYIPVPITLEDFDLNAYDNESRSTMSSEKRYIITNEIYTKAYNRYLLCRYNVKHNNVDSVKSFVNQNLLLTSEENFQIHLSCYYCFHQRTLLDEAIYYGNFELCRYFLKINHRINQIFSFERHDWDQAKINNPMLSHILRSAAAFGQMELIDEMWKMIMYGTLDIDIGCYDSNDLILDLSSCLVKAIENKQYDTIDWLLNKLKFHATSKKFQKILKKPFATAIIENDLIAIKKLIHLNQKENFENEKDRILYLFVDYVVWKDNTALQTAFMHCNDNFQLLEYLLKQHKPKFNKNNLKNWEKTDSYLDTIITTERDEEQQQVIAKIKIKGLKGPITFKPDCEGFTIDDRIKQCNELGTLTEEECTALQSQLELIRHKCGIQMQLTG